MKRRGQDLQLLAITYKTGLRATQKAKDFLFKNRQNKKSCEDNYEAIMTNVVKSKLQMTTCE